MTVTPQDAAPRRAPRWMWIALVLSVAFNLLVVGMAAAALLHFRHGHDGPSGRFQSFIDTLPVERQKTLRASLGDQRERIRPLRKQVREARRRARELFAAEPFEREKLIQAYSEATDARIAINKARGEWFVNMANLLTADERRAFLEWRRKHHGRRGHWHSRPPRD